MRINSTRFLTLTSFFILLVLSNVLAAQSVVPSNKGKLFVGYQGWFNTEGDGMGMGYRHYGRGYDSDPSKAKVTIEIWPDVSELSPQERYPTTFKHKDGSTAELFSSSHPRTVNRHFQWMKDYRIDGAFFQRFATELKNKKRKFALDRVLDNVRMASLNTGVEWALMYDLSGLKEGDIESVLIPDLKRLVAEGITEDRNYIQHNGKPLISIWGIGFNDGRKYTLKESDKLVSVLKDKTELGVEFSVMLGVPHKWRELNQDAVDDPYLLEVLKKSDIVSPWAVGRYGRLSEVDDNKTRLVADKKWLDEADVDYLPVIFPGFSWHNLEKNRGRESKLGLIPRLKGEFLWRQANVAKQAGADFIYIAMFDEVDEATAIFKTTNNPPVNAPFLADEGLPSDHYLWVSSQIKRLLGGNIPDNSKLPVRK